jgi:putative flippase GtrA
MELRAAGGGSSAGMRLRSRLRPGASTMLVCVTAEPSLFKRTTSHRFVRYGAVSAISTVTSLSILGLLVGVLGFPATLSNLVAIAVGTIPSFELNRRWVWSQGGQRSLVRQALPYCLLSFAGLVVSTIAVHLAADATSTSTRLVRTTAVEMANLGSYGALWILQFGLCDRVLFRARTERMPDEPTVAGMAIPRAMVMTGATSGSMRSPGMIRPGVPSVKTPKTTVAASMQPSSGAGSHTTAEPHIIGPPLPNSGSSLPNPADSPKPGTVWSAVDLTR